MARRCSDSRADRARPVRPVRSPAFPRLDRCAIARVSSAVVATSHALREIVMARKTSFYYAFLVLPADQRRAVVAVWDFCRAVDDAVDEPSDDCQGASPQEAICFWRAELARCFNGETPQTQ